MMLSGIWCKFGVRSPPAVPKAERAAVNRDKIFPPAEPGADRGINPERASCRGGCNSI